MCIALISTAHPKYHFIILSNRDEFLKRPTAPAHWWQPPNEHVLGGRDLQRTEQGTWLGITRQGRIAILTNFREDGDTYRPAEKSRGGIPNAWLISPPATRENPKAFATRLIEDVGVHDRGGFSLVFGELRKHNRGLSIVSNRSTNAEDVVPIVTAPGETCGLSNTHFGDKSWPKVVNGERLLAEAIAQDAKKDRIDQRAFLDDLFDILSIDMLPERKAEEDWDTYVKQMRNSIKIPPVGGVSTESKSADSMASGKAGPDTPDHSDVQVHEFGYGTQKQTVILVDSEGQVTFVEKTLYDERGLRVEGDAGRREFTFDIQEWADT